MTGLGIFFPLFISSPENAQTSIKSSNYLQSRHTYSRFSYEAGIPVLNQSRIINIFAGNTMKARLREYLHWQHRVCYSYLEYLCSVSLF